MKIQFDRPPAQAAQSHGVAVNYAPARRNAPRWRWYLLLGLVLLLPAYVLLRFFYSVSFDTVPGLVQTGQSTVVAIAPGRVQRISAQGAALKAGQEVAMLAPLDRPLAPAPAALAATPMGRDEESAALVALRGVHSAQAAVWQRALDVATRQLAIHSDRVRQLERLRAQGAATEQELSSARLQRLQAEGDVARAHADLGAWRERRAQLAQQSAALDDARMAQTTAAPQAASASAPVWGEVVSAPFDADLVQALVRPGEVVPAGTELAVLRAHVAPHVQAYVMPEDARYAQAGREATLQFLDGGRVRAKVVAVAPAAAPAPLDRSSPLSPRAPSLVVKLEPLTPLPAAYQVERLPLDVRFDWVWPW